MTLSNDIGDQLNVSLVSGSKRRSRKWLWIAAVGVVAAAALWFFLRPAAPPIFVTQPVTRGPLVTAINATGTLSPRDQVDVGAEISGRIDDLFVDYNDPVTKGQKLAKINTEQLEAQLGQTKASLLQAQATLAQDEANLRRSEALLKIKALSQQQYDAARADLLRAQAGVAQAKAQVQANETQIRKATIFSPIDGVVLDRKVSRGQTVVAAMTTPILFTLASNLSRMELDVDIDEADVGTVRPGQPASFTVDAYSGKVFPAKLISVRNAPQTTNNVVTYKGVLLVDNPALFLKPGMTATAEIVTGQSKDALLVPNSALRFVPPQASVGVVPPAPVGPDVGRVWIEKSGKLVPHDLKLGSTNGLLTKIVSGDLKPGDVVVTDTRTPVAP
jgi:HlyD family secretion protein